MSNLTENTVWESGIYQLETTDPVLGGEPNFVGGSPTEGHANAQAQQLANRTNYLKQRVDEDLANATDPARGAGMVGYKAPLTGAAGRTLASRLSDTVSVKDFGAKGDYVTDDLPAIQAAIASGASVIEVPSGIYRCSDGFTIPSGVRLVGGGAPHLGFGTVDDKKYLRPGYHTQMPGSSFIFSGVGTQTASLPQRTDEFSTVRYCVRTLDTKVGSSRRALQGIAIIQDMVCFDEAGASNRPDADQRADYEVGLLIDDTARTLLEDVVVFGYFPKAGTVISSRLGNDDPDYNTWFGGSTMGKHGLALLGGSNPASHGLSGTRLFGTGLYTLDHHSRGSMTTEERIAYYADADTWSPLWIDGAVDAGSAEINGHYFYSCEIRTRANHSIRLGKASNVQFFGCVFESAMYGIPNSDTPTFIGSADVKRGVGFYGCRMNYSSMIFNDQFAGLIPVSIAVSGDPLQGRTATVNRDPDGGYGAVILGAHGGVGDPAIQFTKDVNNQNADWKLNMDLSSSHQMQFRYAGVNMLSLTTSGIRVPAGGERRLLHELPSGPLVIASGAITVTHSYHSVSPESGSSGVLQTINGGVEGMRLVLRPTSSSHVITLRRGAGSNIRLDGSADKVLSGSLSRIELMFTGNLWVQISPVTTCG